MGQTSKEVKILLKSLVELLVVVILIRGTILELYQIPSGSMIPTLKIGDKILVTKFNFGFRLPFLADTIFQYRTPERGEIVVFSREDDPATEEHEDSINLVKRVVGLPGETVEVKGRKVFINGEVLDESYAVYLEDGQNAFPATKIPEGRVFCLGDNRDHSKDSRFWTPPFLPISRVKGKAWIIFFNSDNFSRIGKLIK